MAESDYRYIRWSLNKNRVTSRGAHWRKDAVITTKDLPTPAAGLAFCLTPPRCWPAGQLHSAAPLRQILSKYGIPIYLQHLVLPQLQLSCLLLLLLFFILLTRLLRSPASHPSTRFCTPAPSRRACRGEPLANPLSKCQPTTTQPGRAPTTSAPPIPPTLH